MTSRIRFVIVMALVVFSLFSISYNQKAIHGLQNKQYMTVPNLVEQMAGTVVFIEALDEYDLRLWSGSGVLICPNGLIVTAKHVVEDANSFRIVLSDGQEFFTDKPYSYLKGDLGCIQLQDVNDLPYARLGSYKGVRVGEKVIVIGSPFGMELFNTVTVGVVSGKDRDILFFGECPMLQIDAATNPGSSGGPVFNERGQIIGIVVGSKYYSDGLHIAMTVKSVKDMLQEMQSAERDESTSLCH